MKRGRACAHPHASVAVAMLSHVIGLAGAIAAILVSSLGIAVAGGGVVMLTLGPLFGRGHGEYFGNIVAPVAIGCGTLEGRPALMRPIDCAPAIPRVQRRPSERTFCQARSSCDINRQSSPSRLQLWIFRERLLLIFVNVCKDIAR